MIVPSLFAGTTTTIVATSFSNTVSLGSIFVTALLGVGTIVGIIYGVKWKATAEASQATIDLWQSNAEGERVKADAATIDRERLIEANNQLRSEVQRLAALPNMDTLAHAVDSLATALDKHDKSSESHGEKMVSVLTEILDRLPIQVAN